jgi:hypothetical protein
MAVQITQRLGREKWREKEFIRRLNQRPRDPVHRGVELRVARTTGDPEEAAAAAARDAWTILVAA